MKVYKFEHYMYDVDQEGHVYFYRTLKEALAEYERMLPDTANRSTNVRMSIHECRPDHKDVLSLLNRHHITEVRVIKDWDTDPRRKEIEANE